MNLRRYCTLVLLVSSSLCYGFDSSSLKHASLGIGKLGLGFICAYIGITGTFEKSDSLLQDYRDKNQMLLDLEDCYGELKDDGISGLLFKNNSYGMNRDLTKVLSRGCLIGVSVYGAYRCMTSARESFKKAWKLETATEESKNQNQNQNVNK